MGAPDIARFRSTLSYEATRTLPELEQDLAQIRGLDERAQNIAWMGWLSIVPIPLCVGLAFAIESRDLSPIIAIAGVPLTIAYVIVIWRLRRYDVENRRYEFANGLLRILRLLPQAPVKMGLVLTPIDKSAKVVGRAGDWTYHKDPWLFIEGQLADGVRFHFVRTGFYDFYFHKEHRGNRIRTTTQQRWHFEDVLTLLFDPARFTEAARLAAHAREQLGLPKALQIRHFDSSPGRIVLVIAGDFKWDATPSGDVGQAVDAVTLAGVLFASLYRVLGAAPGVDLAAAKALPPPRAIAPKAPLTGKEYAIVGLSSVMALASIGFFISAQSSFDRSDRNDSYEAVIDRALKVDAACRQRPQSFSAPCLTPQQITHHRREAKSHREVSEELWNDGILYVVLGSVLGVLALGGFVAWRLLRKRWIAVGDGSPGQSGADEVRRSAWSARPLRRLP